MAEARPMLSAHDKFVIVQQYKQDGNAAFKAKDFKIALRNYHKALLYIRALDQHALKVPMMMASADQERQREQRQQELTEHLTAKVDQLKVDVYNNMSACLLQDDERFNLKKVLEYCSEVNELQPSNPKGWFRRGQAYAKAGNYGRAQESLLKVKSLMRETDPAVEQLLATSRQMLKLEYAQHKSLYENMFATRTGGAAGDTKT